MDEQYSNESGNYVRETAYLTFERAEVLKSLHESEEKEIE